MRKDISPHIAGRNLRFFLFMLAFLFCPQVWTSVYADDVSIALNDSNYYEISSAAQLKLFANKVNGGDSGIKDRKSVV